MGLAYLPTNQLGWFGGPVMLHGWSGTLTTTPGPFELQAYPAFRGSKASLSVCVCV